MECNFFSIPHRDRPCFVPTGTDEESQDDMRRLMCVGAVARWAEDSCYFWLWCERGDPSSPFLETYFAVSTTNDFNLARTEQLTPTAEGAFLDLIRNTLD